MKQTHPAVWRMVDQRQKINPRPDPADRRRRIADYIETLECGHVIRYVHCDEEPTETRRSCAECRKSRNQKAKDTREHQQRIESLRRQIEHDEKRVLDRQTCADLTEESLSSLEQLVRETRETWQRHKNLSDTVRGHETFKIAKDITNYSEGLTSHLSDMMSGRNRETDRLKAAEHLIKVKAELEELLKGGE